MHVQLAYFPFRVGQRRLLSIPARRTLPRSVLLPVVLTGLATGLRAATLDTGDITAEAAALLTVFQIIGAIAAVVAIIFAALSIRGRNIGEGIVSLLCAVGAIFIIGHAQGWVTSITGIAVQ
ncbi:MAG TPA: hypothetical protein VFD98_08585 [Terracidiphilus sp.]|jgi:hypothetical protein|nr:hypothetical protein [Terracidiphilus sp.]